MYWPEKVYDLLLNENKHYISELIPLINMFICIKSLERYTLSEKIKKLMFKWNQKGKEELLRKNYLRQRE